MAARRKSRKISPLRLVARLFALTFVVAAAAAGWFYLELGSIRLSKPVLVQIPRGSGAQTAGKLLERSGAIRSAAAFALYARLAGKSAAIRAGKYRFSGEQDAREVLDRLVRGETLIEEVRVTIPEGFTLRQIARRLAQTGAIRDEEAFLQYCAGEALPRIEGLEMPKNGLEGYLFPDTYLLERGSRPEEAVRAMLAPLAERFAVPFEADIRRSGQSLRNLVIIASLIEREARTDPDRPRISGVIANRLKKGMRLEVDATVLYALGAHKSRVLYKDLEIDSPYNTYRRKGLPPGPIASPGLESLMAALRPEKHAFLYYVARPDGSHVFSRTKAEHDTAVRNLRAAARAAGGQRSAG